MSTFNERRMVYGYGVARCAWGNIYCTEVFIDAMRIDSFINRNEVIVEILFGEYKNVLISFR